MSNRRKMGKFVPCHVHGMLKNREFLLDSASVGIGAAAGAITRFGIGVLVTRRGYTSITSTAGVNVTGSFILGAIAASSPIPRRMKLGLGVGFCGGFTTFSTFAVDLVGLIEAGELITASTYFVSTNVGSCGAALAGASVAKKALSRGRL